MTVRQNNVAPRSGGFDCFSSSSHPFPMGLYGSFFCVAMVTSLAEKRHSTPFPNEPDTTINAGFFSKLGEELQTDKVCGRIKGG